MTTTPGSPWQPPSAEELQKTLPQYEVAQMLGRGGMGAVYMGRQISLDRPVAIKILSGELEDADVGFSERFKNEAKAMAKLNHPGIVSVYDFGETEGGLLYIVMEYVDGTDVSRMIAANGRIHTEHAMAITAHVCDALAYAHERGIIHRDIKPANIMVGYDGSVKVADFGLAKVSTANGSTMGLTQSGMAMGTLHFMAPEALILGAAVDHRADIYAVGVMLYQMLTGKLPQGMFKMPSLQIPGLDPRYDGIIAMAMMEDRDLRYASVSKMREALDGVLTQSFVQAVSAPDASAARLPPAARPRSPQGRPTQRHRTPPPASTPGRHFPVVAMLLLMLVGGGVWLYYNQPESKIDAVGIPKADSDPSTISKPPPAQTRKDEAETTLVSKKPASEASQPPMNVPAVVTQPSTLKPATDTLASNNASAKSAASIFQPRPSVVPSPVFTNLIGMQFVTLPGTRTLMCIHETRRLDYEKFAAETPRLDSSWRSTNQNGTPLPQDGSHPVTMISWNDAREFCEWLSRKEGRRYRLPTDREWSIAVGISELETVTGATPKDFEQQNADIYPWGMQWPPPEGAGNVADESTRTVFQKEYINGYKDGFDTTSPVMSFPPNRLGLFDLTGNVWEFCEDWYDRDQSTKVLRGGHFGESKAAELAASCRADSKPFTRSSSDGFRVVLEDDLTPRSEPVSPAKKLQDVLLGRWKSTGKIPWSYEFGADQIVTAHGPSGVPKKHQYSTRGETVMWTPDVSGLLKLTYQPPGTLLGQTSQGSVMRLERIGDLPLPAASPTLWVDARGRRLKAAYVRLEGDKVILNIAGKETPVSLLSLSLESQKIATGLSASATLLKSQSTQPRPADLTKDLSLVKISFGTGPITAGTAVPISVSIKNKASTPITLPFSDRAGVCGVTRQFWIERMGRKKDIPAYQAGRKGDWYAAGGNQVTLPMGKTILQPGEELPIRDRISTQGFPIGKYRFHIEIEPIDSEEVVMHETFDFELVP